MKGHEPVPDSRNTLRKQQLAFAAHLRNPDVNPPPADIEDRRLQIYRDLFLGNLVSLLASSFPVLRQIYGEAAWRQLVRQFLVQHRSHTPIFAEVPGEFVAFLESEYQPSADDPPFLLELAHYEWAELALATLDTPIPWEQIDRHGNLLDAAPAVSPLAWPLAYQFPVHRISADFQPDTPGTEPTRLVVYRDQRDAVGFIEINVVTARLLELAQDNQQRRSGRELLQTIAAELDHPNPDTVIAGGREILERLKTKDVLLGTYLR